MPGQPPGNPVTAAIVAFLCEIGIEVRLGPTPAEAFLPGIWLDHGAIVVDEALMLYPGDLLHEAGHLAVATPERRATIAGNAGADQAEEMMAIAWSYAAALHMGLDPLIVFHDQGYRGGGRAIVESFAAGRYFGLPMLQWVGMALEPKRAAEQGGPAFPQMLLWLRPDAQ